MADSGQKWCISKSLCNLILINLFLLAFAFVNSAETNIEIKHESEHSQPLKAMNFLWQPNQDAAYQHLWPVSYCTRTERTVMHFLP